MFLNSIKAVVVNNIFYMLLLLCLCVFKFCPLDKGIKSGDEFTTRLIALGMPRDILIEEGVEFYNIYIQKNNTICDVFKMTQLDNGNSLFYNVLLHVWLKTFGYSDTSAKFFSFFLFVLLSLVVYLYVKKYFNKRTANISICLLFANPILLLWSDIVRAYMLGLLMITFSSFLFYRAVNENYNQRVIVAYYSMSILAVFSHYFTSFLIVFHIIYLVVKGDYIMLKKMFRHSIIIMAIIGLPVYLYLKETIELLNLWVTHNVYLSEENLKWSKIVTFKTLTNQLFFNYTTLTGLKIYWDLLNIFKVRYLIPLISIPLIFNICFFLNIIKNQKDRMLNIFLFFMALSSIVFNILIAIYTKTTASLSIHYFIFSLPFYLIIIAISVNQLIEKNKTRFFAYILFVVLVLCNLYDVLNYNKVITKNEIDYIAKETKKYSKNDLLIIHHDYNIAKYFNSYLFEKDSIKQVYIDDFEKRNNILFVIDKRDTVSYKITNLSVFVF